MSTHDKSPTSTSLSAVLEYLAAVKVVVKDDIAMALRKFVQKISRGVLGIILAHSAVVAVGADDSLGIAAMQLGECHEECERVIETTDNKQPLTLTGR